MNTENKIKIKSWIKNNPVLAKMLLSSKADIHLLQLSTDTGLSPLFIKQNLSLIKNWI